MYRSSRRHFARCTPRGTVAALALLGACAPTGQHRAQLLATFPPAESNTVYSVDEIEALGGRAPVRIECTAQQLPGYSGVPSDSAVLGAQFVVNEEGTVERGSIDIVRLTRGSTTDMFVEATRAMLATCVYEPAVLDQQRVRVSYDIQITLNLAERRPTSPHRSSSPTQ